MAKINSNASDKQNDAMTTTSNLLDSITVTTNPVVITAVQRKANLGNFETLDIYMAVAIPQSDLANMDEATLRESLEKAADFGFSVVGKETGDRYRSIKEQSRANEQRK